jgi:hypothetical protein
MFHLRFTANVIYVTLTCTRTQWHEETQHRLITEMHSIQALCNMQKQSKIASDFYPEGA